MKEEGSEKRLLETQLLRDLFSAIEFEGVSINVFKMVS